jgi:hypothetical protein
VLIAAKISEDNFLIDDRRHQFFPFNGFLSIKMLWAQTVFTNSEIVSLDGHIVSGNLRKNFLLHDL